MEIFKGKIWISGVCGEAVLEQLEELLRDLAVHNLTVASSWASDLDMVTASLMISVKEGEVTIQDEETLASELIDGIKRSVGAAFRDEMASGVMERECRITFDGRFEHSKSFILRFERRSRGRLLRLAEASARTGAVALISMLAACGAGKQNEKIDHTNDVSGPTPSTGSQPTSAPAPISSGVIKPATEKNFKVSGNLKKIIADFYVDLDNYHVDQSSKLELRVAEFVPKERYSDGKEFEHANLLGYCQFMEAEDGKIFGEIYLKPPELRFGKSWEQMDSSEYYSIVHTVYHEMAHCVLKLGHLEDYGIDVGEKKAIMSMYGQHNQGHALAKKAEYKEDSFKLASLFFEVDADGFSAALSRAVGGPSAKKIISRIQEIKKSPSRSQTQITDDLAWLVYERLIDGKTDEDLAKEKIKEMTKELFTDQISKIKMKEFL
jgi:hypothetical protein